MASDVAEGLDEVFRSNFVTGKAKKSYRDSNPGEHKRVASYLAGGSEPSPFPATLMGSGLTKLERARRAAKEEPLPANVALSAPTPKVAA